MSSRIQIDKKIIITEIFESIQGEGHYSGFPCSFIRLTGCNLACKWCDTTYAYDNGSEMDIRDIVDEINHFDNKLVEITGGEPLLQENVYDLFDELHRFDKQILLETNGSILIDKVPEYVHIIMDIKTPASEAFSKNSINNLSYLKKSDEVKIVISDYEDFLWALKTCTVHKLFDFFEKPIILQPAYESLQAQDLAGWILDKGKFFKMGVQLHKYVFGEFVRGV